MIPNPVSSEDFDKKFFFSEKNKEIYSQVRQGQAFSNPLQNQIVTTSSLVSDSIVPRFDEYISLSQPIPPGFTLISVTAIRDTLVDTFLPSQINFYNHTNLLSGVTLTNSSEIPNLRTIVSVGSTSVAIDNALNETVGNPCGKLLNAFGALFLGQDLYNQMTTFYQNLIGLMELGEYIDADVQGQIDVFTNQLNSLVQNDKDYFNSLIQDLLYYSISAMLPGWLNDPCGRYMIEKVIGSKNLLQIL